MRPKRRLSMTPHRLSPAHVRIISAILLTLIVFVPLPGLAQSLDNLTQVMMSANESYQNGQFEQAIDDYESLIAADVQHGTVYFNLGNAYLQQRNIGYAILNYRRAQRLNPRDSDIAMNLNIARTQTIDKIEISGVGQVDFGQIIGRWVTMGEMALLLLAIWLVICICAGLYIILPRFRRWLGWLMVGWGGLLVGGIVLVGTTIYFEQTNPAAVVVVSEIAVTDGPGGADEFQVNFTLHAGAEVNIVERRLGWRQVALPGDLKGWAPLNTIELIVEEE